MRLTKVAAFVGLAAFVAHRLYHAPIVGTLHYILMSPPLDSPDMPVAPSNADFEVENGVRHRFVHVGRTLDGRDTDVTLHFIETGYDKGQEAVVFFAGFPETSEAYRYQLREMQDQFHCIAVDVKGFGQSSKPYSNIIYPELNESGGDYERSAFSAEVVTALDSMGVRQFNLVGTDLGGWYTHILAGDWAARILRYASVQITIASNELNSIPQSYLLLNYPRPFVSVFESRPLGLAEFVIGAPDKSRWLLPGLIDNVRARSPVAEETLKALKRGVMHRFTHGPSAGRPSAYHAWAAFYNALPQPLPLVTISGMHSFQKYNFPVLIMQGKEDPGQPLRTFDGSLRMDCRTDGYDRDTRNALPTWNCKPARAAQRPDPGYAPWGGIFPAFTKAAPASSFFPNASSVEMILVDDCGHFVHHEKPQFYVAKLRAFLSKART